MKAPRDARIAVVSLRHGADVLGGAEAVLREAALGLHARGWNVEVLTTTAENLYSFAPSLPAGMSSDEGVPVRRFDIVPPNRGDDSIGHQLWAGARLSQAEELRWMNTGARSPGLFEHVLEHADQYTALICGPYHAWTAFVCAEIVPQKVMLMPCLHDEPMARMDIFRHEFEDSRSLWFLSEPEMDLAQRMFCLPQSARVMGAGVNVPDAYDRDGFRARHGLEAPFLLYAGRRERMKGWSELLEQVAFANRVLDAPWHVATCGGGGLGDIPAGLAVHDLGFLPDAERSNAFAAAAAYMQPSRMESFSRTVMEAWLAQTLVIANAASDVVRWHCERSGAGLVYSDRYELMEALRLLQDEPDICRAMAAKGRDYVLGNYTWDTVLDKVEAALAELM
ncbi:MAG TPA: glycosyltransferase [Dehalococcoidia bacterium]|nr:glycosyltransferase [Dehalococcoidia bacterium]